MDLYRAVQRVDGSSEVALFQPRFALNIKGAGAIGFEQQGLGSFHEGIVGAISIEIADCQSHMSFRSVLPSERALEEFCRLREGAFGDAHVPQFARSECQYQKICARDLRRIAGFASSCGGTEAKLQLVNCW